MDYSKSARGRLFLADIGAPIDLAEEKQAAVDRAKAKRAISLFQKSRLPWQQTRKAFTARQRNPVAR